MQDSALLDVPNGVDFVGLIELIDIETLYFVMKNIKKIRLYKVIF